MSKRLSIALISVAFALVLVLGAVWHRLWVSPFPQLSRSVDEQTAGFRATYRAYSDLWAPDSIAGHIRRPHSVMTLKWKEHPSGSIRMAANNLGFRKDADTPTKKPSQTYRILVTGDSHIDGAVYNSESFPNRLEALLNTSYQRPQFEVLNGGTSFYGPYNYAGFLKRSLHLNPDMFVVVLYTGNDFLDGIETAEIRQRIRIPERPEGYLRALQEARSKSSGAVWQALNQAYFLKTYPELEATAVDIAYGQLLDIARMCSSEGVELVVLTLPTRCDMSAVSRKTSWRAASRKLGLTSGEVEINRRMGRRLLARLSAAGVLTLDPFDEMQPQGDGLYWETDYHLNPVGHDLLARIVFDYLKTVLVGTQQREKPVAPAKGTARGE